MDLTDCPDAELLRLIGRQDRAALSALYDRHSGVLYATVLRIIPEPAEAQDVLHDVFLQVCRKAASFDPAGERPVGWLITVARNLALDRVRQSRRRRELLAAQHEVAAAVVAGEEEVLRRDDTRHLAGSVAGLPAEQREALELAYFGGYTQEEIATKLSQPLGTIKARIRRGLLRLRSSLTGLP